MSHALYKARAARVGIQQYETGPEHRDASEVFSPASLATWQGAPVTVGHVNVEMSNVSDLAIGYVRKAWRDDDGAHVAVEIVITDPKVAARIDARDLVELSAGYSVDVDTSGPTKEQRNIRINHLAIGPSNWARCGATCAVL